MLSFEVYFFAGMLALFLLPLTVMVLTVMVRELYRTHLANRRINKDRRWHDIHANDGFGIVQLIERRRKERRRS